MTSKLSVPICSFAEDVAFVLPQPEAAAQWLQGVIQEEGQTLVHLNFVFCSDNYLHAKNVQYLQHDTWTDVITFDYAEAPEQVEGDVYISIDRVRDNAPTYQHTFCQELYTVMVHGVLHLLGYQDHTPTEKALMRQQEAKYVAQALQQGLKM